MALNVAVALMWCTVLSFVTQSFIGAVEVLGAFDLAAGPHEYAYVVINAKDNPCSVPTRWSLWQLQVRGLWHFLLWLIMKL